MSSKISNKIEKIKVNLARKFHLKPSVTNEYDIQHILEYMPREYWYDIIKNMIWKSDIENCYIAAKDYEGLSVLPFSLEDLKRNYFNIEPGDILTHRKYAGIYVADSYITLDKRFENKYCKDDKKKLAEKIIYFGNSVGCEGINKYGSLSGFEWGDYLINIDTASYHNFDHIDYIPKEGELFYYLRKSALGEIHWKDNWKWYKMIDKGIYINYKADHRKIYESWFKEYD